MHDITIELTDTEFQRLHKAASASGKTADQLVADELRARHALGKPAGELVLMRPVPRAGGDRGRD